MDRYYMVLCSCPYHWYMVLSQQVLLIPLHPPVRRISLARWPRNYPRDAVPGQCSTCIYLLLTGYIRRLHRSFRHECFELEPTLLCRRCGGDHTRTRVIATALTTSAACGTVRVATFFAFLLFLFASPPLSFLFLFLPATFLSPSLTAFLLPLALALLFSPLS